MKPDVISVTESTPCFLPENRDIFDRVIDITVDRQAGKEDSRLLTGFINAARRVCAECPAREQCLDVHGRDYRLGVIAGTTDRQREEFFEEKTA